MSEQELDEAIAYLYRFQAQKPMELAANELVRLRQAEKDWMSDAQALMDAAGERTEDKAASMLMRLLSPIKALRKRLTESRQRLEQRQPEQAAQGTS